MKRKLLIGISIVAALYIAFCLGIGYAGHTELRATQSAATTVTAPTRSELLALVNAERAKVGATPLKEDARLDASAQYKASDMVDRNYFGHYDPSNTSVMNGVQMGYTVTNHDTCKIVSENIVGAKTAESALDWWMNSKQHREALLNGKYSLTGFGIAFTKDIPLSRIVSSKPVSTDLTDSYVVVEHFCEQ